ncbi:unnamed protein product [Peniophora sp. CBMAI 1063]|nr:unnamed protein product [Peniophora sp. CBMAI 1063]
MIASFDIGLMDWSAGEGDLETYPTQYEAGKIPIPLKLGDDLARPIRPLPKFNKIKKNLPAPAEPAQTPNTPAPASPAPVTSQPSSTSATPRSKRPIPAGYTFATRWGDSVLFSYGSDYRPPYHENEVFKGEVGVDALYRKFEYIRQPMPYDESSPHLMFVRIPRLGREDSDEFRGAWREDWDEERLLPIAEQKKRRKDRGDEDLSNELIKVGYFSRQKVHDVEKIRVHDLKTDYEEAVALLQEVMRKKELKEGSMEREVIDKMLLPDAIVSTMWKSWARIHWFGVLTDAEYQICHRVYQRTAGETDAWLDMMAMLLGPSVRKRPNHALYRRLSLGPSPRRGSVFAGDDIDTYHGFYHKLGLPTYVNIAHEDLEHDVLKSIKLSNADGLRCSGEVSAKLSTIQQKTLPSSWYPPLHAVWDAFEPQARGYAPRAESEEDFRPAELVVARKRKADNVMQNKKRIKVLQEQREERRDDKYHRMQTDVGTSRERYAMYASVSPAFRRQFDRLATPPPKWLPTVYAPFLLAESQVLSHAQISIVEDKGTSGSLWTWVPPLHLMASKDAKRNARTLVNVVHALPLLLLRIKLARTDKTYGRLGVRGWRRFCADVVTKETFWGEKGGHINKEVLLSQKDFERLQKLPDAQRPWGKLPCGHEATEDLLLDDEQLQASLCYSLNQWALLYALCGMISDDDMEKAGIPALVDKGGEHRSPDFVYLDSQKSTPALVAARDVAMYSRPINTDGWPAMWAPDTLNVKHRRHWLKKFATLLAHAKGRAALDKYMRKRPHEANAWDGWALGNILRDANPHQPYTPEREESLEDHLLLRYALTSLQTLKQWPVAFFDRPRGDVHKCRRCYEEERQQREEERKKMEEEGRTGTLDTGMAERFENDWDDLSDEGSDD